METVLVVDDDEAIRTQMKWGFSGKFEVVAAANRKEALTQMARHRPPVVTLDLGLPPDAAGCSEGLLVLKEIVALSPSTKVIVLTGNEAREPAIEAVRCGAYDYCRKPADLAELAVILKRAVHIAGIEEENRKLQAVVPHEGFCGIIGNCKAMQDVYATVRKVASSDVPVLITGESGTGKELVARALCRLSQRKKGPFMPINAAAIPENLLESELFGHEKGAFTGAHSRQLGKVEFAHCGTLFLDEIGEIPLSLQVKLLRFLQDKVIQRVGGREVIPVDARIITATNRDLASAIVAGSFRDDLYYRISVISIHLPPLRERGADIMLLATLFLKSFSEKLKKRVRVLAPGVQETLERYPWPGNVRELENRLQRAVLMADSSIVTAEAMGLTSAKVEAAGAGECQETLKDARNRLERDMVKSAIRQGRNLARAAESLGISRPTLYDLMKKHQISNDG